MTTVRLIWPLSSASATFLMKMSHAVQVVRPMELHEDKKGDFYKL